MSTYINLHNDIPNTPCYSSHDMDRLEARLAERGDSLTRPATWAVIVAAMDTTTCEQVHAELAPCTMRVFLARYLELATEPLVIG